MNNLTTDTLFNVKPDLKKLSLEELRKLKENIGNICKNTTTKKTISKDGSITVKRNKNRPSEISSKIEVPLNRIKKVPQVKTIEKKPKCIDPRFDSLYGDFNKHIFEQNYNFLNNIRDKEKKKLQKKLKQKGPEEKKEQIKLLLQRMNNQEREKQKMETQKKIKSEQKQKRLIALKEGKKPQFLKKRETKLLQLVDQYESLKSTGKLNKHIKLKKIRIAGNEKKTIFNNSTE